MNRELELLIFAYEKVSALRDQEAGDALVTFESLLNRVMERQPNLTRDNLRRSVIKAHRKWALKQGSKPPAMPPKA